MVGFSPSLLGPPVLQALTPAMEQWKKRLGQIAMSFDSTHKVDGTAGKHLKHEAADAIPSQVGFSPLPHPPSPPRQLPPLPPSQQAGPTPHSTLPGWF